MLNLKREDLESVVNEQGLIDENNNYSLLELVVTTLTCVAIFASNDPAAATALNAATIDYLLLVDSLTNPINVDDPDLGKINLRPVEVPEYEPPKPVEVINVQQQQS